jgi:long-subunit acyl-CoA synthetase (AMP-forming)
MTEPWSYHPDGSPVLSLADIIRKRAAAPPRLKHWPADDRGDLADPDETALILYTSGTTGAPKGVELTGRNLGCALHELHASIGLDSQAVCAAPIPFFHIAGLGLLLALPECQTADWSSLSYHNVR